jgi:hypothetical protein
VAETRAAWDNFPSGPKGIVGHVDCTKAYPEDGGDHTDPGPEFPWDVFLDLVKQEMTGDEDMTKADFLGWLKDPEVREALCRAVNYTDGVLPAPAGSKSPDGTTNEFWTAWGFFLNNYNATVSARTYAAKAATLPSGVEVSKEQLQAAIVGALTELAAKPQ